MTLTVDTLADAMQHGVAADRYAQLLPAVNACLLECDCTTVDRVAMWMGQVGEESGGLRWMEELASGAEYNGRVDLGNTQSGDGPRFKGGGPIQVTGRHNYTVLSQWAFDQGWFRRARTSSTTPTSCPLTSTASSVSPGTGRFSSHGSTNSPTIAISRMRQRRSTAPHGSAIRASMPTGFKIAVNVDGTPWTSVTRSCRTPTACTTPRSTRSLASPAIRTGSPT